MTPGIVGKLDDYRLARGSGQLPPALGEIGRAHV